MKKQIVGILIICISVSLFSQTTDSLVRNDTLVRKGFHYYYGEQKLRGRAVKSVLSSCPFALKKYNNAQGMGLFGAVLLLCGSMLITSSISGQINADVSPAVFVVSGIGSYGLGVVLLFGSRKIRRGAISSFNAGKCKVEPKPAPTYKR